MIEFCLVVPLESILEDVDSGDIFHSDATDKVIGHVKHQMESLRTYRNKIIGYKILHMVLKKYCQNTGLKEVTLDKEGTKLLDYVQVLTGESHFGKILNI